MPDISLPFTYCQVYPAGKVPGPTRSSIEWTDFTWNVYTGCDHKSPGCDNCYAWRVAGRMKVQFQQPRYQNDGAPQTSGPGFGLTVQEDRIDAPRHWKVTRGHLVFVNSDSDLFHEAIAFETLDRVFATMEATPETTYQILTKRASRLADYAGNRYKNRRWPENVWAGVSVELQGYTTRLQHLRKVPATVRFVSVEPMLGPVNLDLEGVGWVIVGGESGPAIVWPIDAFDPRLVAARLRSGWERVRTFKGEGIRRPIIELDPFGPTGDWVRSIRDSCVSTGVPFFFKQWGGSTGHAAGGRMLDGHTWDELPLGKTPLPKRLGIAQAATKKVSHRK